MTEPYSRAEVLAGLRAAAKSRLNCGHPLCGKGTHPHTVTAANAPQSVPQGDAKSTMPRGQPWDEMVCAGVCRKPKSKSEFYASSGRVCKKCWNRRASKRDAPL